MKRNILLMLFTLYAAFASIQAQTMMESAHYMGTFGGDFNYTDTRNTTDYEQNTDDHFTNGIFYKFVITKSVELTISHCNSETSDTFIHLLDANGDCIAENDDNEEGCANGMQAYLRVEYLSPGTYYVVSHGVYEDGDITTNIRGVTINSTSSWVRVDTKPTGFTYSNTMDTKYCFNNYVGRSTNDVTYMLTLIVPMTVFISQCESLVDRVDLSLLDESGNLIAFNRGYDSESDCPVSTKGYLRRELPAGTYYVVSEGYSQNGSITTSIRGVPLPVTHDLGTKTTFFTSTHTQNTLNCINTYGDPTTNDVFYKFAITQRMKLIVSLSAPHVQYTNVYVLDDKKNRIADCEGHFRQAYLEIEELAPGTYYVVSEGQFMENGIITTEIEGIPFTNHIKTIRPTKETSTINGLTTANSLQTISYFDGLGKPIQTIQVGITPEMRDLVTHQEYDGMGRISNSWLPLTVGVNRGNFVAPDTLIERKNIVYGEQKTYSTTIYEESPLNRISRIYEPGDDWFSKEKSKKIDYLTNIDGDYNLNCVHYTATDALTDTVMTIKREGNYPSRQLYVTRSEDEDGSVSLEFKDKLGKVVLTRQIVRNGPIKVAHDTYYVYDILGNLKAVLPPLAADAMKAGTSWTSNVDTVLINYAYLYRYDIWNRCIVKKLPGALCIRQVYDKANHLIFTQDGEQRAKKEWFFNFSDVFGRTVLTGICKGVDGSAISNARFENGIVTAEYYSNGLYNGYTPKLGSSQLSLDSHIILTTNYYDTYDFLLQNGFADLGYSILTGEDACFNTRATKTNDSKTLLTGAIVADADAGTVKVYSAMYYDQRGRLIQNRSTNHLGGLDSEYVNYNFTGAPLKKLHIHRKLKNDASTERRELYTYSYDHAGRQLTTTHQLGNGTPVILASNTYDNLGRLKTTKKGALPATTYDYNIRSWLKSISSSLFTETLYYNDSYAGNTPSYTGNISAMSWKIGNETLRGYTFAYDDLSRLTQANYLLGGIANDSYKVPTITYDKHGNISSLERWGKTTTGATYGMVDKLTMNYTGNQLTKVTDAGVSVSMNESGDFKAYKVENENYTYNKNGALKKDSNKGITGISYNSLNLPKQLDINNTKGRGQNTYTYLANGRKVKVVQLTGSSLTNTLTTDYVGNHIYENGVLKRTLVDGGYMEGGSYYFYVTDHLGNNRVVTDASGNIIQKNHYYPFGMTFAEVANLEQDKQPYKYNGKELDRLDGLNLYDYGARHYEPALGRFTTMDPLAEKYYSVSPYAYCLNNSLKYVDPNGKDVQIIIEGNRITIRANIILTGALATKELSKIYKEDIMDNWGLINSYMDGNTKYSVNWDVNVRPAYQNEKMNFDGVNNYLNVVKTDQSEIINSNTGRIRSKSFDGGDMGFSNPMSHEFGHILGLSDKYMKDEANYGKPISEEWAYNIMAAQAGLGSVDEKNMKQLLDSALKMHGLLDKLRPKSKEDPNSLFKSTPNFFNATFYNINKDNREK